MTRFQGYGWLIVAALAAVALPVSQIDRYATQALSAVLPLPWARIGLGALVFWAVAALYFRSHWGATLRSLRQQHAHSARTARRLDDVVADGERSSYVLHDNLVELTVANPPAAQRQLYLEGALAHAKKMQEIMQRCRAIREDVDGAGGT